MAFGHHDPLLLLTVFYLWLKVIPYDRSVGLRAAPSSLEEGCYINYINELTLQTYDFLCEIVFRGRDPSVNVVLLEDAAAVLGLTIAASCISLSYYTGSSLPDAVGSLLIGSLLGGVASFIIYTNTLALVGK